MNFKVNKYFQGIALGAALAVFPCATVALAQDRPRDDHGRSEDQRRRPDDRDRHDNGRSEYHFRAEDRDHFSPHYQKDIRQWRQHPDRRHNFRAGERLPSGVSLKSVPTSYYRALPPPPPGYRFGYYDGYVVAYNPTTQIVADVLDLVNSAVNR
jgi:Ni/Co efflux regulator RcnB